MSAAYRAGVARRTKWVFIFVFVVGALITGSAVIDCIFSLGWGYHWRDVWGGFAIMGGQFLVYLFCLGIFRLVDGVMGPR